MSWISDAGKKISGGVKTAAGEVADFVKDPVDGFENMGEELRRWRDNVRNLNPAGVSEELWGEGGRFAYPAAAAIMAKRSPTGEPLSDPYKAALRPYFGSVVDSVTIHWATPPLDEWAADNFSISLEDTDTEAQTYGHDIYVRFSKGEKDGEDELSTFAHELVHVQQFEKYDSSYANFGYHYFKEYKQAALSYERIDMEEEAYHRQAEFKRTQQTVALQNTAATQWQGWYLDIDGSNGKVILWNHLGSGGRWKLAELDNGTVALQVTAEVPWKHWYLDIDGNTGEVILWDHLASGGRWKLTELGGNVVALQVTADVRWKDWYLDIDGTSGRVILWDHLGSGGRWKRTLLA